MIRLVIHSEAASQGKNTCLEYHNITSYQVMSPQKTRRSLLRPPKSKHQSKAPAEPAVHPPTRRTAHGIRTRGLLVSGCDSCRVAALIAIFPSYSIALHGHVKPCQPTSKTISTLPFVRRLNCELFSCSDQLRSRRRHFPYQGFRPLRLTSLVHGLLQDLQARKRSPFRCLRLIPGP